MNQMIPAAFHIRELHRQELLEVAERERLAASAMTRSSASSPPCRLAANHRLDVWGQLAQWALRMRRRIWAAGAAERNGQAPKPLG